MAFVEPSRKRMLSLVGACMVHGRVILLNPQGCDGSQGLVSDNRSQDLGLPLRAQAGQIWAILGLGSRLLLMHDMSRGKVGP